MSVSGPDRPLTLDAGLALVHLWHPKRTDDPRYYHQQRANFALLSARLQEAGDRA